MTKYGTTRKKGLSHYGMFKERLQEEVNAFPLFAAFTGEQFDEGYKKLGLKDGEHVTCLGAGVYVPSSKIDDFHAMFKRHDEALAEAMQDEGFAYDAFVYELEDNEYGYTWDEGPAIDALGLSCEDVENNAMLLAAFIKARDYVRGRE